MINDPSFLLDSRMQTMAVSGELRPSMFVVMRTSIVESGIRSLYTGLSASILRQMTYSMVRLSSYDNFKAWLKSKGHASTGELLLAAMAAGALGGMAGNPAGASRSILSRAFRKSEITFEPPLQI